MVSDDTSFFGNVIFWFDLIWLLMLSLHLIWVFFVWFIKFNGRNLSVKCYVHILDQIYYQSFKCANSKKSKIHSNQIKTNLTMSEKLHWLWKLTYNCQACQWLRSFSRKKYCKSFENPAFVTWCNLLFKMTTPYEQIWSAIWFKFLVDTLRPCSPHPQPAALPASLTGCFVQIWPFCGYILYSLKCIVNVI